MTITVDGIVPVMLTPFTQDNSIDWDGYSRLIDWYLENGATALFAVCQSSEMQFLSLEERIALAKFTVKQVAGRVPVVVSGHVSDKFSDQIHELNVMAETGADGVVLVTNRLAAEEDTSDILIRNVDAIIDVLPADITLGLYECPAPFRRLLSDNELEHCAQTGRFSFLKDVSCDLDVVKRRIGIVKGTPLGIVNANAAIAWPAMQAGSTGFSGVFNNIHPDLYAWLYHHGSAYPELAEELATFLVLAAQAESMGYPKFAKHYHQRLGTFSEAVSRVQDFDIFERFWGVSPIMDRIAQGNDFYRRKVSGLVK
ncbi:dihydrodipicolinate synthase family protein [Marinomonas piezotolerans]|uniref:Dihydrodipicolinate synthase family protein n=1 Tax=Marinomonas piezotolerans TaxID=2213058 RepID=A0A370U9R8_9GAMM|nr:dihydrodipicolinate synthase family protein [Marinomonas piezotolerans]RDL44522.1 dihydrodipicolinate synthase family protein [Marinomonas piezotolerans]